MIRITVEIIPPNGYQQKLAILDITNIGPHGLAEERADYLCRSITVLPNGDNSVQRWSVQGFERLRFNVWGLIIYALVNLGPEFFENNSDALPASHLQKPAVDLLHLMNSLLGE